MLVFILFCLPGFWTNSFVWELNGVPTRNSHCPPSSPSWPALYSSQRSCFKELWYCMHLTFGCVAPSWVANRCRALNAICTDVPLTWEKWLTYVLWCINYDNRLSSPHNRNSLSCCVRLPRLRTFFLTKYKTTIFFPSDIYYNFSI